MLKELTPPKLGQWAVYLLRRKDQRDLKATGQGSRKFYVGMSNYVGKRLYDHNAGVNRSTRGQQWELIAYVPCKSRSEAALVERWLKLGDSRKKRMELWELCQLEGEAHSVAVKTFINRARFWQAQKNLEEGFGIRPVTASKSATKEEEKNHANT